MTYRADDWAKCGRWEAWGDTHPAPVVDCTCGFYAMRDREAVEPVGGIAVLEVELSGRVIRHERGYRAERQRVMSVAVDRLCWGWLENGCTAEPVGLSYRRAQVVPTCQEHSEGRSASLLEVAGVLGTEVRWGEAPPTVGLQCSACGGPIWGIGEFDPAMLVFCGPCTVYGMRGAASLGG